MKALNVLILALAVLVPFAQAALAQEETAAARPEVEASTPAEDPGEVAEPEPPGRGARGRGHGRGQGGGCCGSCGGGQGPDGAGCRGGGADVEAATTVSGQVLTWEGGPGEKMPTLTLVAGDDWLEIFVGPNRAWLDAGFEPAVGQELEVTYAPTRTNSHLVALSVTDPASGKTVDLRDRETGKPDGRGDDGPGCGCGRGRGRGRGRG